MDAGSVNNLKKYHVRRINQKIDLSSPWDSNSWNQAETAELNIHVGKSSDHKPQTFIRMLYDDNNLYGLFLVHDQYVRAIHVSDQSAVSTDSCVEFYAHPAGSENYFNFEINCGGTMLLYHITHLRSGNYTKIPQEDMNTIERYHTLPKMVVPEIQEPITWRLGFRIPISFFVKYSKINPILKGQIWRGNFIKCGAETSHPHGFSWIPLSTTDYHSPNDFGEIIFL